MTSLAPSMLATSLVMGRKASGPSSGASAAVRLAAGRCVSRL